MEKKEFYVTVGYCGHLCSTPGNRAYGCGTVNVIPVICTEDEIEDQARSIGRRLLADSCSISLDEEDAWDTYVKPWKVLWDCM